MDLHERARQEAEKAKKYFQSKKEILDIQFGIRIPEDLLREIEDLAQEDGRTKSDWMRTALTYMVSIRKGREIK